MLKKLTLLSAELILLFTLAGLAQIAGPGRPAQAPDSSPPGATKNIRIDVSVALVNVTVTDPYGRIVSGLEKEDFHVFEDGIEQEIQEFSGEDAPVSIGVIFDISGSMTNKLDQARQAAIQFFKTANPKDEFFLVTFNDRARLTAGFTSNVDELQDKIMYTVAKGDTALLDAIYLGLSVMSRAQNGRHALLIISDGGDNHSRYNETDVRNIVKEADCQLYAIGIYDQGYLWQPFEERLGPTLLHELAETTGGRMFSLRNLNDLSDIAEEIGTELRNQYILGYTPTNKMYDGGWRKIKVRLIPPRGLPPLTLYAKTGYYAPKR